MNNPNCQFHHQGTCNHSAGRGWFGGKRCILSDFVDERISACRFQMEYPRPKAPPGAPSRAPIAQPAPERMV